MILLSIQQLGAQLISSANKPWCPWFPNLTPPWRHQALRRILYRPKAAGMSGAPGNGQKVAVWISTDGDSDICPWISMDQYLYINTSKYWEYHFVGGWTSSYTSEILDHQVFDDFWPISQQTSPSAWPYSQPSAAARWCSGWCAWCGKQARFFWERNRWTAWWFVHSVGNVIIPTDEVIFFRGVGWNHQPVMGMLAETGEKSSKKCCLKCVGAPQVPNILQLPKKNMAQHSIWLKGFADFAQEWWAFPGSCAIQCDQVSRLRWSRGKDILTIRSDSMLLWLHSGKLT